MSIQSRENVHQWILLFCAGISLLFSGPRILMVLFQEDPGVIGLEGEWMLLQAFTSLVVGFFAYLVTAYFNVWIYRRFRGPRQRIFFTITLNFFGFIFLSVLAWILHERIAGAVEYPELLRRNYVGRIFVATLLIVAAVYLWVYFRANQRMMLENARIKELHAEAQLTALRHQINPHFLFNSLNTLSAVIRTGDRERGVNLVDQLSSVYRYVLRVNREATVPLQDEINFLNNFADLLRARFGDKFNLRIQLSSDLLSRHIPPLALQLLLENAVKHNVISRSSPLVVDIVTEGDWVIVSNPLRPRPHQEGGGVGLINLSERYRLLQAPSPIIERQEGTFLVKLPLLSP
ncbi:sensor histidine kinase [Lewinella sp. W8]|uniref:sensor histidine kinase n=1 Tax=Lewinella sp. W8 TaxID=2528208 RepID=UPI001566CB46|nr:histidine kinase [Lewinella sp. W8]